MLFTRVVKLEVFPQFDHVVSNMRISHNDWFQSGYVFERTDENASYQRFTLLLLGSLTFDTTGKKGSWCKKFQTHSR